MLPENIGRPPECRRVSCPVLKIGDQYFVCFVQIVHKKRHFLISYEKISLVRITHSSPPVYLGLCFEYLKPEYHVQVSILTIYFNKMAVFLFVCFSGTFSYLSTYFCVMITQVLVQTFNTRGKYQWHYSSSIPTRTRWHLAPLKFWLYT